MFLAFHLSQNVLARNFDLKLSKPSRGCEGSHYDSGGAGGHADGGARPEVVLASSSSTLESSCMIGYRGIFDKKFFIHKRCQDIHTVCDIANRPDSIAAVHCRKNAFFLGPCDTCAASSRSGILRQCLEQFVPTTCTRSTHAGPKIIRKGPCVNEYTVFH